MNLVASRPALIGVDWGTTSLRIFLISEDNQIMQRALAPEGIAQMSDKTYEAVLNRLIGSWNLPERIPVVASGMITSRNGWIETPYVQLPVGKAELANSIVLHKTSNGRSIHFITGVCSTSCKRPDVIRGEETQIIGALEINQANGAFVLPGTHSKWVQVIDCKINSFRTYMTGEIFAALKKSTVLGALMEDAAFSRDSFLDGVELGLNETSDLLNTLFAVRTKPLLGHLDPEKVADFLSGILIGAEISSALPLSKPYGTVSVIGNSDLTNRYKVALQLAGIQCIELQEDIVAHGHFAIAKAGGLI